MSNQEQQHSEQRRAIGTDIERRAIGELVEVRAMPDGKKKVKGYALTWNQRYSMGWFTEEIDRTALNGADLSDVRALLNHDPNIVLGRTTAGTLRLFEDETGLGYEIELPDTQAARDLAVSIERGDISQSSWGFMLRVDDDGNGDEWRREDGRDHRVIKRVSRVFDVSPVTFPANPETTVAKRSFEAVQAEQEAIRSRQEIINRRKAQLRSLLAANTNK